MMPAVDVLPAAPDLAFPDEAAAPGGLAEFVHAVTAIAAASSTVTAIDRREVVIRRDVRMPSILHDAAHRFA